MYITTCNTYLLEYVILEPLPAATTHPSISVLQEAYNVRRLGRYRYLLLYLLQTYTVYAYTILFTRFTYVVSENNKDA